MLSSIPTNSFDGDVVVTGLIRNNINQSTDSVTASISNTYTKVIDPVNLLESVPPKSISPLVVDTDVGGSKEIPISSVLMKCWASKLSGTVGTLPPSLVVSMQKMLS